MYKFKYTIYPFLYHCQYIPFFFLLYSLVAVSVGFVTKKLIIKDVFTFSFNDFRRTNYSEGVIVHLESSPLHEILLVYHRNYFSYEVISLHHRLKTLSLSKLNYFPIFFFPLYFHSIFF